MLAMLGDDWPSPPMFQYLLLENPWPLGGVAAIVAAALFIMGGRQGRSDLQLVSLGFAAAAAATFVAAYLVETEREKLIGKSQAMVHAFADPFEPQVMESLITEDVRLFNWPVGHLMSVAENAADAVEITRYHIRRVEVEQDGPNHARTGVSVIGRLSHRTGENAFSVQTIFQWRRLSADDDWKIYAITHLYLNGRDAEPVVRNYSRF